MCLLATTDKTSSGIELFILNTQIGCQRQQFNPDPPNSATSRLRDSEKAPSALAS